MELDRLKSLGIFAETVRAGSFRGAARKLGLTPSAVSYHVSQLEQQLAQPLLYRSTRRLSLTDAGERLFATADTLLQLAQDGMQRARDPDAPLQGRLRVTMTSAMAHSHVAAAIARFHRAHPEVALELHYSDLWDDLIADRFDLALRSGALQDSTLKCRLIWQMQRMLVASPDFLNRHGPVHCPADLQDLPWIRFAKMAGSRQLIGPGQQQIEIAQAGQITVNNIEAMVDFTRAGLALSSPPAHFVRDQLGAGDLVRLLPDWQVAPIPVYAVWPAVAVENPATARLLDELVKPGR